MVPVQSARGRDADTYSALMPGPTPSTPHAQTHLLHPLPWEVGSGFAGKEDDFCGKVARLSHME